MKTSTFPIDTGIRLCYNHHILKEEGDSMAETQECGEEQQFQYYKTRILYVHDDVIADTSNSATFVDQLFELSARGNEPILLVIDSYGGLLSQMIMIIDAINAVQQRNICVHTQILGLAASAACVIAACGTHGHRYVSTRSRVMMHQPRISGEVQFDATQMDIERKEIDTLKKMMVDLFIDVTGKSDDKKAVAQLKRDIERDRWFGAQEAVDYGLADIVGISPIIQTITVAKESKE